MLTILAVTSFITLSVWLAIYLYNLKIHHTKSLRWASLLIIHLPLERYGWLLPPWLCLSSIWSTTVSRLGGAGVSLKTLFSSSLSSDMSLTLSAYNNFGSGFCCCRTLRRVLSARSLEVSFIFLRCLRFHLTICLLSICTCYDPWFPGCIPVALYQNLPSFFNDCMCTLSPGSRLAKHLSFLLVSS